MTDEELLAAFESCSLSREQWTHEAHVRVAYLYLTRLDSRQAMHHMREGIRRLNQSLGTPERLDRGYHETITRASMCLIEAAVLDSDPHRTSCEFCEAHSELLEPSILARFYSDERLMTHEAKSAYVPPDLAPLPSPAKTRNSDHDRFTFVEELTPRHVEQLFELTQQQWWGGSRTLDQVRTMVANTSLIVALVDRSSERLIGFARTLSDFAFRATIYDVMIDQEFQGQGIGTLLMDRLIDHPKLRGVSLIYLACEPDLFPFYEKWGFKIYEARSHWMMKVQREE